MVMHARITILNLIYTYQIFICSGNFPLKKYPAIILCGTDLGSRVKMHTYTIQGHLHTVVDKSSQCSDRR